MQGAALWAVQHHYTLGCRALILDSLPLHWRQAVEDSDVPGCALFDHPCPVGPPPGARWGHASAAVGDRLYMFGGDGATMYSDGFMYDSGKLLSHAQL